MPSITSRVSTSRRGDERLRVALLIGFSLFLAACGGSPDDHLPAEAGGPAVADRVIDPAAEAISRAQRLDDELPFSAASVRRIEFPGEEPRTLRLWRRNERPVRLLATGEDTPGHVSERTSFYFDQGELLLVIDPDARYVFEDGRLAIILDDQLDTLTSQPDILETHERELRQRANLYLAAFGED
jgi:hypothetical protein